MTYAGSPATPQTWNTVDLATGAFTKLADCAEGAPLYVDMTYDYSRSKLLGIYHYAGLSGLFLFVAEKFWSNKTRKFAFL